VNRALRDLLSTSGGLLRRSDALAVVPAHVLRQALRSGSLRQVLPLTYADPERAADIEFMTRAAVRYVDGKGALSHTSALRLWRLPVPDRGPVHLTVAESVRLLGTPAVRVHRRLGFRPEPPDVVVRGGYPVTRLEHAVIESWPLLDHDAQRAPAITAVAERLTTPERLTAALKNWPRLPARRGLRELITKLHKGCRSELEIWGYDHIFRDIPGLRRQVPVRANDRRVYLDVFHPATRTNFELDGARYHTDRNRDLRRDAALAAQGISVVRFTHDRLVHETAAVRAEVTAILTARTP
jgi:very-short-patch-repair endonuclease